MEEQELPTERLDGRSELRISANAVSRGIGIGRALFLNGDSILVDVDPLTPDQVEGEIERLKTAFHKAAAELTALSEKDSPASAPGIFGVHLLILDGSSFVSNIESEIRENLTTAERAVRVVSEASAERQRSVDDQHLSDKYIDVKDVADRLLRALGAQTAENYAQLGSVFIVKELMPSRLMDLAKSEPTAVISEHGGWTSHTSILARELKLPVVTGIKNIESSISDGDQIIVDGINGEVVVNPSTRTLEEFLLISDKTPEPVEVVADLNNKTSTIDGCEIVIRANADTLAAYRIALNLGAQGIGLYRSEAIFNQFRGFPAEAEQINAYRQIATSVGDAGVRIRTFDVGVDQLEGEDRIAERNPSLGLRSIRLSLTDSSYFRTQIRAILQASFERKIDIVLPMISGVGDILSSRKIIDEERESLKISGTLVGEPGLGAMIEVPSAVMTAKEIARHVDFLCLGTNDLVQYMLAVDRDNEAVADWYQTLHPAVIRAIREVILAGRDANVAVTVCGEIAGSAFYAPLLIGLGARELSMTVNSIPQIKRLISGITFSDAAQLVDSIGHCESSEEIESMMRNYYLQNWSQLFPAGLLSAKHS